ncbi:hypothetical protein AJ80_06991 [Polytolypa hystricis UAMH7299]|uniref:Mitochondrial thiamine pyrophosphate carrier 1 n=1 Tax=Polytolypa hystricis (strain UAMH7299) TaxID=1447883 RepID=A0A2B7XRX6_POLH7|nr:hypothetical protein AJ80_06991 [Polytolypa hystricis UAMH7299]
MRGETQSERDQRVQNLWETLDTRREGQLDLKGFKKGLKKMDHPLKNADHMLEDVLEAVDTSGDGKIQYNEFRAFVESAEKELWKLFQTIDKDKNGHLDKQELKAAFAKADLAVPNSKIDEFMNEIDTNRDGVITFDEWRDFLLFLPARSPNLRAILSYYSATVNLNLEGDVYINETLKGLGTENLFPIHLLPLRNFLLTTLQIAFADTAMTQLDSPHMSRMYRYPEDTFALNSDAELEWLALPAVASMWMYYRYCEQILTVTTPHIGYFISGGLAGAVSRTCTAPLDRLKVYLIAQTDFRNPAILVEKSGGRFIAIRSGMASLVAATKELWRAGGVRSLFAGNGLNVVKVMPESAIKFGAYEASKRMLAGFEGHDDPKKLLPVSQFLAGGMGGMVSQCFVYPLDTLKFRMQCEVVEGGLHGNRLIAATARSMWVSHGIQSFFRGLPLGLIGMFPYAAIDLTTFEYLKARLVARKARLNHCHEDDAPIGNFSTAAIGAFSGALSASMVYPLNVLRTRLQAQGTILHTPTYTGIMDVARKTIQSEGVRGLFRGLTPNLLKVVPSVSITYVVYENSKRLFGLY